MAKQESKIVKIKRFRTDLTKIRGRAARMERGGVFWNAKPGTNKIRILPPWNDEGVFFLETVLHYGFKVGEENRAFPCLKALGEARCPACMIVARYKDEKDPDIKKITTQMKPKGKWFMNIIDRKADTPEVKIFGAGFKVASAILGYFNDEDYEDITDPEEGRDITIEREGTGFTTTYTVRPAAKPSPIGIEGWEENLHDLSTEAIRETIDAKQMVSILEDTYADTDMDFSGLLPKKARVVEPEEEEEEELVQPKKNIKLKKVVKKKVEDDEDDTDLDDDDDEEDDD